MFRCLTCCDIIAARYPCNLGAREFKSPLQCGSINVLDSIHNETCANSQCAYEITHMGEYSATWELSMISEIYLVEKATVSGKYESFQIAMFSRLADYLYLSGEKQNAVKDAFIDCEIEILPSFVPCCDGQLSRFNC